MDWNLKTRESLQCYMYFFFFLEYQWNLNAKLPTLSYTIQIHGRFYIIRIYIYVYLNTYKNDCM